MGLDAVRDSHVDPSLKPKATPVWRRRCWCRLERSRAPCEVKSALLKTIVSSIGPSLNFQLIRSRRRLARVIDPVWRPTCAGGQVTLASVMERYSCHAVNFAKHVLACAPSMGPQLGEVERPQRLKSNDAAARRDNPSFLGLTSFLRVTDRCGIRRDLYEFCRSRSTFPQVPLPQAVTVSSRIGHLVGGCVFYCAVTLYDVKTAEM